MINLKLLVVPLHDEELASKAGTYSEEYAVASAKAFLSTNDMRKLGLNDGDCVEVSFLDSKVIVRAFEMEGLDDGFIILPMSPWAMAILPPILNSEGQPVYGRITVKVRPAKCPPTSWNSLI